MNKVLLLMRCDCHVVDEVMVMISIIIIKHHSLFFRCVIHDDDVIVKIVVENCCPASKPQTTISADKSNRILEAGAGITRRGVELDQPHTSDQRREDPEAQLEQTNQNIRIRPEQLVVWFSCPSLLLKLIDEKRNVPEHVRHKGSKKQPIAQRPRHVHSQSTENVPEPMQAQVHAADRHMQRKEERDGNNERRLAWIRSEGGRDQGRPEVGLLAVQFVVELVVLGEEQLPEGIADVLEEVAGHEVGEDGGACGVRGGEAVLEGVRHLAAPQHGWAWRPGQGKRVLDDVRGVEGDGERDAEVGGEERVAGPGEEAQQQDVEGPRAEVRPEAEVVRPEGPLGAFAAGIIAAHHLDGDDALDLVVAAVLREVVVANRFVCGESSRIVATTNTNTVGS